MNAAELSTTRWQLPLWSLVLFSIGIAVWFALLTQNSGIATPYLFFTSAIAVLSTIHFFSVKRYAVAFLCVGYIFVLVVSLFIVIDRTVRLKVLRRSKETTLAIIAESMNQYYTDWKRYPPSDSPSARAALRTYYSKMPSNRPQAINTMTGFDGNPLTWQIDEKDFVIIIDEGKDGLPGKYKRLDRFYERLPSDLNQNGIDDGDDDQYVTRRLGTDAE